MNERTISAEKPTKKPLKVIFRRAVSLGVLPGLVSPIVAVPGDIFDLIELENGGVLSGATAEEFGWRLCFSNRANPRAELVNPKDRERVLGR